MKIGKIAVPKMIESAFVGCCIVFSSIAATPVTADDGRTGLTVTEDQQEFILLEMRVFLESVQGIISAVTENDMEEISEIARAVGMAEAAKTPPDIVAILPDEFKMLAGATHMGFDVLANEAQDMGDTEAILVQLGDLMQNCTGCHAGYRLDLIN